MSKKTTAGNILIVAVSLLVAALLAEVVLRQIRPVDFGRSSFYRIPHPVYGWVLEPGVSYINYMREAPVPVSYNSKGWRDIEHAVDKPDGVTRILVLGDSFMEAYSVPFEDSLPARLQQLAGQGGQQVEVINLGVAGYGTLQEYLVYRDHGRQYQPDIVLLGFYVANDVRNNSYALESLVTPESIRTGTPPFLDPGGEDEWKLTMPLYEATMERYLESKKEREAIREASGGSALLMGLLRLPGKLEKAMWEMSSSGDAQQEQFRHLMYQGINYCKEPPEWTEAWDITRRVLARLDREVTEAGSKLLIFSVPAMHEVDVDRMKKVEEDAPESGLLCLEEAPGYARLAGILGELEVEFIDLLPVFRKAAQGSGNSLFRHSDRHWNEAGHQLAAEHILPTLYDNQWLERN